MTVEFKVENTSTAIESLNPFKCLGNLKKKFRYSQEMK